MLERQIPDNYLEIDYRFLSHPYHCNFHNYHRHPC